MNIFLCFLVAFLSPLKVHIVGDVSYGEIVVPVLLAINFNRTLRVLQTCSLAKWFLYLAICYFLAQVFADFYRHSVPYDYIRGWAKIGILILSYLAFLGAFWNRDKAVLASVLGSIASLSISVFLPTLDESDPYKWLYGSHLTTVILLIAGWIFRRLPAVSIGLIISVGALSLMMNSRSLGGLTISCAMMVWLGSSLPGKLSFVTNRMLVFGGLVGTTIGLSILYNWAAPQGLLGVAAENKYFMQTENSDTGKFTILSGRSESLFAVPKILQSPFIGWGSWARDYDYVIGRQKELNINYVGSEQENADLIPTHSHILGGWLEAGIFGGIFWLTYAWLVARNLFFMRPVISASLFILINFVCLSQLFMLLFNPNGGSGRVEIGALLAWQINIAARLGFDRIWQLMPQPVKFNKTLLPQKNQQSWGSQGA